MSSVPKGSKDSMSDIIKNMMKSIDEKQIKKFDEITLPSFKVEVSNQELAQNL